MAKLVHFVITAWVFMLPAVKHMAAAETQPSKHHLNLALLFESSAHKQYYISIQPTDLDSANATCTQAKFSPKPLQLLSIEDEAEYTKILWKLQNVDNVQGIWTSGQLASTNTNNSAVWLATGRKIEYTNFNDVTKQLRIKKHDPIVTKKVAAANALALASAAKAPSTCNCANSDNNGEESFEGSNNSVYDDIAPFALPAAKLSRVKRCGEGTICEAKPCDLQVLPCEVSRPDCTVTCTPKCKTYLPPCSVKCPPCKVTTPECHITNMDCDVIAEECKVVQDPCNVMTPKCTTYRPPCIKKEGECIKTTPVPCTVPSTTLCPFIDCQETTPPCIITEKPCYKHKPSCYTQKEPCAYKQHQPPKCKTKFTCENGFCANSTVCEPGGGSGGLYCPEPVEICPEEILVCGETETICPQSKTTCKPCEPPIICQSEAIICKQPTIICPPAIVNCPEPVVECPPPQTICSPPRVNCSEAQSYCPPPVIECPSPIVTCPSPVTVCDPPEVECLKPILTCPEIKPNCTAATKCRPSIPCPTTPLTSTTPSTSTSTAGSTTSSTTPCPCAKKRSTRGLSTPSPLAVSLGYIYLNYEHGFKWDIASTKKNQFHFICETK